MKKIFNKMMIGTILYAMLFIILGLILFIKPDIAQKVIGYLLGGVILLSGINSILKYYMNKRQLTMFNFEIILGVLSTLLGIFILIKPLFIANTITIILGIWMILSGSIKIKHAINLKQYKEEYWWITLIVSVLTLLIGSLLVFNPFSGTMMITEVIGIFVILYGILDIVEALLLKKNVNNLIKFIKK